MNAVFTIDDLVINKIREIRKYAEAPKRRYKATQYSKMSLGRDPGYILSAGDVRAVFSMTQIDPGNIYRHLSVNVIYNSESHYPVAEVVYTLAHLFGFTGGKVNESGLVMEKCRDWDIETDESEKTIMVTQKISTLN